MRRVLRLLVCAFQALPAATARAQAQDTTNVPWVRESLTSATLHETRTLLVATPDGYQSTTDSFPVLVLLDAEDRSQFEAAIANARFLANRGEIPGLVIVGVTNGKDRTHDMTPAAMGSTDGQFPTAGGADAFEAFIVDEALPLVRAKFRTRPGTILAGHSFGGLFGLYVAAMRRHPYAGIIAMSPSIWWNDSSVADTYADDLAGVTGGLRLFATSGAFEGAIDRPTRHFIARLDSLKPRGISYGYLGLSDATHGLTPVPSLIAGLRFVFEPVSVARLPISRLDPNADSAAVVNAVIASEATYARGARSLSLPDKIPEAVINGLGYGVLQFWKLPKVAVWVFAKNVTNYPASANVYDSYADALAAAGDTTAAIAQYKRAVALWEARHDPSASVSRDKLAALEKAVRRP
jgi:predicted alpha/beta superfamily hydrolase